MFIIPLDVVHLIVSVTFIFLVLCFVIATVLLGLVLYFAKDASEEVFYTIVFVVVIVILLVI
jgi:hypothetical protein